MTKEGDALRNDKDAMAGTLESPYNRKSQARAIESAYHTAEFSLFQCVGRGIKADCFFVEFNAPPARFIKEVALEPNKLGAGHKAFLVPVDDTIC